MNAPQIDPKQAIDLSDLAAAAEAVEDRAEAEAQERTEAQARVDAWMRAMRRTFKGIFPHRERLRQLARVQREMAEGIRDESGRLVA